MNVRLLFCGAVLLAVGYFQAAGMADDALPSAKPVPRMQIIPEPRDEASVQRDGREICRFYFDPALERPFLYPLIGPSGRSLTRIGHPHDPNGHSHHNSVWISHNDINGIDFWGDTGAGTIRTVKVNRYVDGDDVATIEVENHWVAEASRVLLRERRTMRFIPLEGGQWMLMLDLEFAPVEETVTIGATPFGFLGVRMAKTIGVRDGGGTIRNSEGETNEKEVFRKPARWVDYSGPVTMDAIEGITLFDHRDNSGYPTAFHVRDDGWMGASASLNQERTLEPGSTLRLRYGLWIHAGLPSPEEIEEVCERYHEVDISIAEDDVSK